MSRKNVLAPTVPIATAQSMAANFTTDPTIIDYMDNCCYQINVTANGSSGTFGVQVSLDYETGNGLNNARTGNWVDLALDGTPTISGSDDNIIINMNQVPFRAVRLKYVSSVAGTGVATIYMMNKSIGA